MVAYIFSTKPEWIFSLKSRESLKALYEINDFTDGLNITPKTWPAVEQAAIRRLKCTKFLKGGSS